jgi:hypothetical protein
MHTANERHPVLRLVTLSALIAASLQAAPTAAANEGPVSALAPTELAMLAPRLQVGDVVFIRIGFRPFAEVADATHTWTNHVGVVVGVSGAEPIVAESAFPLSRTTPLSRFVARSAGGRFAVTRLNDQPTPGQGQAIVSAARRRLGILYDTGFDLHSSRQFCSRFVREVLQEGTGRSIGDVETFADLLVRRPDAHLSFWRVWYFGRIPWQRETVTPASVLRSTQMHVLFDGVATAAR